MIHERDASSNIRLKLLKNLIFSFFVYLVIVSDIFANEQASSKDSIFLDSRPIIDVQEWVNLPKGSQEYWNLFFDKNLKRRSSVVEIVDKYCDNYKISVQNTSGWLSIAVGSKENQIEITVPISNKIVNYYCGDIADTVDCFDGSNYVTLQLLNEKIIFYCISLYNVD